MRKIYRSNEFATRIAKSLSTLRRWDSDGTLPAKRTPGGHRIYDESDVRRALGIEVEASKKKTVIYCRVSSGGQKNDLASQKRAMQEFCLASGIAIGELIEEIGGGMNFKRKRFLDIMQRIETGDIGLLIIAHKDRLVRFGFDYLDWFASEHGCKIIVANQEKLSPHQEMVEDLMAIVHCFSSRLYGLRSYKKKIKEAAESDV